MKSLLTKSILFAALIFAATVSAQTGGTFEITQSVVSNGGGASANGNFGLTGTAAQSIAGTISTGGAFASQGGFWQAFLAPTAAMVSIGGVVLQDGGGGIFKAHVSLTGGSAARTALTNQFGYFRFDDVEVGQTYIVSVSHKRFHFENDTQVVFVVDEITGITFTALP